MKNIYKIIFISILISVSFYNSYSQTAPGIEWQNSIGGSQDELVGYIAQTNDGGYILGGSSQSNISGDKTENTNGGFDYWIIKTDPSGNIQWQNTIGGSFGDILKTIVQTADGGYFLGGYSTSNISGDKTENSNGGCDFWIIKTDSSGIIQWQNTIGGDSLDALMSAQQTIDGGYILGGYSASNISGDKTENSNGSDDFWIIKTDSSGLIQWQNTIGGNGEDRLSSIQQTSDGGYILSGTSLSNISGDKTENSNGDRDYWIVKTDSLGAIQWQNTIGGNNYDEALPILQTDDDGYIIGGHSNSFISGDKTENSNGYLDYWIVKTDGAGVIQWQNTIGGNYSEYLWSMVQTNDGGYILGGWSQSNLSGDKSENCIGGHDPWVVKTDSTGNIQWENTIGGSLHDYLGIIRQTADGGYIFCGTSYSNISGDKSENNQDTTLNTIDFWIVKLFPDTITGLHDPQTTIRNPQFFPNPITAQSKLTFHNPNNEKFLFTLFDITGRMTECVITKDNEIIVTKGSKPSGVYLFNLLNEKTGEKLNGKIIIAN